MISSRCALLAATVCAVVSLSAAVREEFGRSRIFRSNSDADMIIKPQHHRLRRQMPYPDPYEILASMARSLPDASAPSMPVPFYAPGDIRARSLAAPYPYDLLGAGERYRYNSLHTMDEMRRRTLNEMLMRGLDIYPQIGRDWTTSYANAVSNFATSRGTPTSISSHTVGSPNGPVSTIITQKDPSGTRTYVYEHQSTSPRPSRYSTPEATPVPSPSGTGGAVLTGVVRSVPKKELPMPVLTAVGTVKKQKGDKADSDEVVSETTTEAA